jgi:hypothetical protein
MGQDVAQEKSMLAALLFPLALAFQQPSQLDILAPYDNTAARAGVGSDWGFAALIEYRGHTVLFDTGANPERLLRNMKALNVDASRIEAMVIGGPLRRVPAEPFDARVFPGCVSEGGV